VAEAVASGAAKAAEATSKADAAEKKLAAERGRWQDDAQEVQQRLEAQLREALHALEDVERSLGGRAADAEAKARILQVRVCSSRLTETFASTTRRLCSLLG
jgi:hypothetical protein